MYFSTETSSLWRLMEMAEIFFYTEKSVLPIRHSVREETLALSWRVYSSYLSPSTFNFWLKLHFRFAHPTIQIYGTIDLFLAGFPVSPVETDLGRKAVSSLKEPWRERMKFGSK